MMRSAAAWIVLLALAPCADAQEKPLHALIDQHLVPIAGITPQPSSDAEFLRRVSLDLVGMPPTADQAREFILDTAADKRLRLIDRLLASPQFARHFATVLDIMLMERRPATHVPLDQWQAWLLSAVRENKPWNELAREILKADGADAARRAPARFVLDRASEPNLITRDVGRVFFGRDLQCAQCHDHPVVGDYLQSDYHGLLAYLAPSYALLRTEGEMQTTIQAEKAGTDLLFESVFVGIPRRTGARMPGGRMLDEPFFLPGEEYNVAPADNVQAEPKFSRREKLAELATDGTNDAFNRNIANRLWAHMFGRGLVHPVDWQNPENPPTHPALLQALSDELVAMNFNIQEFLREIALSDAYQRSFEAPATPSDAPIAEVTPLEARCAELETSAQQSTDAYADAATAWEEAEAALLPVAAELDKARDAFAAAKAKADETATAAAAAEAQRKAKSEIAQSVEQAATAAHKALELLPDDKELAGTSAKFTAKSGKLTSELSALTKAADETRNAAEAAAQAWSQTKPPIDHQLAALAPLKAKFIELEKVMHEARQRASRDAERLAALEKRLESSNQLAELTTLHRALVAAEQTLTKLKANLTAAKTHHAGIDALCKERDAAGSAAAAAVEAAAGATKSATAEHTKNQQFFTTIAAAERALQAAQAKAPEQTPLAAIAGRLGAVVAKAQTATATSQQQLDQAKSAEQAASAAFVAAQEALAAALAERARCDEALQSATAACTQAQKDADSKQATYAAARDQLAERLTEDFTIASLKPLTPEQLCWSILRVTGIYDRTWRAEAAELEKTKPLSEDQKKDPGQLEAHDAEIEQRVYDKLKVNLPTFVALYGAAAGQPQGEFFATADQALFVANGAPLNDWVAPLDDSIAKRIASAPEPHSAAEELYLGVLSRMPTEEEVAAVAAYLADREPAAAAQELLWAMLNSAEFRFNH